MYLTSLPLSLGTAFPRKVTPVSCWRSDLPSEIEVVWIEMIFALCLHVHLLQSAFQTPKLFLSPCIDKPNLFVIFLYCHSICCPQLQACAWPLQWLWSGLWLEEGCVSLSMYLLSPVPLSVCHSPFLPLYFVQMPSAFSPGDLGKNILENISCTALSCKCLPSSQYHLLKWSSLECWVPHYLGFTAFALKAFSSSIF